MFGAFGKAFAQLGDPRILRVVIRAVVGAVLVYAGLIAGFAWVLAQSWVENLPLAGTVVGAFAAWGAGLGAVIIATVLFPGVVSALVGLWLEDVAAAVEARHYPHLAPPRRVPLGEALGASLRLAVTVVVINVILLPLYLVLFFIPPLNLLLYYGVNGRLLGREYFEAVALRRMDSATVEVLRRSYGGTIWLAGAITAALLTVPLLNMLAPVIGVAAMVHVFTKLTRSP